MALAGGTCLHGVWLTLEDDGAAGCWGPASPESKETWGGGGADRATPPSILLPTVRELGGGSWLLSPGGRGRGCQVCVLAAKPVQSPVCRASAVKGAGTPLPPSPRSPSSVPSGSTSVSDGPDGHQEI